MGEADNARLDQAGDRGAHAAVLWILGSVLDHCGVRPRRAAFTAAGDRSSPPLQVHGSDVAAERLTTSPAACPPMPSAISEEMRSPTSSTSSLEARCRTTSVRAPPRRSASTNPLLTWCTGRSRRSRQTTKRQLSARYRWTAPVTSSTPRHPPQPGPRSCATGTERSSHECRPPRAVPRGRDRRGTHARLRRSAFCSEPDWATCPGSPTAHRKDRVVPVPGGST